MLYTISNKGALRKIREFVTHKKFWIKVFSVLINRKDDSSVCTIPSWDEHDKFDFSRFTNSCKQIKKYTYIGYLDSGFIKCLLKNSLIKNYYGLDKNTKIYKKKAV